MNNNKNFNPLLIRRICLSMMISAMLIVVGCTQTPTETPMPSSTETAVPTETAVHTATSQPSPTPTDPPAISVQPDDLEGIALRFMHPWIGGTAQTIEEIATQFSLSNPYGIWVDVEGYGGETALVEALLLAADDGGLPDLVSIHPYQLGALDGAYNTVALTDYFSDPEWGFDEDAQTDISDVLLEPFMLEGELIALPVAPQATLLFYNLSWAEELGFDAPPEGEVDFRTQSCSATFANREDVNPEKEDTGGWVINYDPNVLSGWFHSFGGDLPEWGTPQFDTEAGRNAFGYLKAVSGQGCFWIGRKPEPYFYFANRYALSYAGTLEGIPEQVGWMNVAESEDQWTVMGFPGPEGQVILIDGPGLMIGENSPEKQLAAWLFARHLMTPEVQARLVRSLFTLPVRRSSLPLLEDFAEDFPQWGKGVALLGDAVALPMSEEWGVSQWLLQDAVFRLLQSGDLSSDEVLEELDQMIVDLVGTGP